MTRLRTFRNAALSVLLSIGFGCGRASSDCQYTIKVLDGTSLDEEYAGLGKIKVTAIDTRDGHQFDVVEPFKDKITQGWCYGWDTLAAGVWPTNYDLVAIDLMSDPQVRGLVASTGDSGSSETFAVCVCCSPTAGLKGLQCVAEIPPKREALVQRPKPFAGFYCICDSDGGGLVYVDGEPIEEYLKQNVRCYRTEDGNWPPDQEPFFDHDGTHFYYFMHGYVKRFDVATQKIDTIPGADIPLIPWNEEAVIVYCRDEKKARLLDEKFQIKADIDWQLDGRIHTVYAVDSTTLLVGVRRLYVAPGSFGIDSRTLTFIYELDFRRRSTRLLVDGIDTYGQILSAQRIEQ